MEASSQPDQPQENWQIVRQALLDEIYLGTLPMDDIPALLRDDAQANRLTNAVQEKLAIRGIEVDSLDLIEAVLDLTDSRPSDSENEEEGGSGGVREPKNPHPSLGGGAIALAQEPLREPPDMVADITDEEIEQGL